MTNEATRLLAAALKAVKMDGSFAPEAVGSRAGLSKAQSESAARELSNAGVLVLGFDCSANFSPDYRKARARAEAKTHGKSHGKADGKSNGKVASSKKSRRPGAKDRALAEPAISG